MEEEVIEGPEHGDSEMFFEFGEEDIRTMPQSAPVES